MKASLDSLQKKYQSLNEQYKAYVPAMYFLAGFIFDMITIDRIDSLISIAQQIIFLTLTLALLIYSYLYEFHLFIPKGFIKTAWRYKDEAIHFMMGSLLSVFALFYVKSASSIWSFVFIFLLFSILIFNELKQAKKMQARLKWAMFYLCLLSFLMYVSPIIVGSIGWLSFSTTLLMSGICVLTIYKVLIKLGIIKQLIVQEIILPAAVVTSIITVLYTANWIPPVPLSIQHLGIYHNVQKQNGNYVLSYEKPWWRIWNASDENFTAYRGDKIYGFARIFSPIGFDDKVNFHWLYLNKKDKWITAQKIPVSIRGGRGHGYRAYTFKENYSEGKWLLKVETLSGKEIGRIRMNVSLQSGQRNTPFKTIKF